MKDTIVKSSLIQAYLYNSQDKTLKITFKDQAERTYKQVPPDLISKVFDSPGSIGSKFKKLIGRKYTHSNE